jgi:hypothetical protein
MARKLLVGVLMFLVLVVIAGYATTPSYVGTASAVTRPLPVPTGPPGPPVPAPPWPIPPFSSMMAAAVPPVPSGPPGPAVPKPSPIPPRNPMPTPFVAGTPLIG